MIPIKKMLDGLEALRLIFGLVDEQYKMDLIVNLVEARAPAPKKRGKYKKSNQAEISN